MTEDKKEVRVNTNRQTLSYYWEQMKRHKPSFLMAFILIPTAALFIDTLLPYFLSLAIGALSSGNYAEAQDQLQVAAAAGIFGGVINLIGFQSLLRQESEVRDGLTTKTFSRIINKDLSFFVNTKVGALTSRFIDFIRSHVALQDLLIMRTLGFILSVGVGLAILFAKTPTVGIAISLLILVLIIQIRWSVKKRTPWRNERKELIGQIHGHVADSVTNFLVVKTFAKENAELKTIDNLSTRYKKAFIKDWGFAGAEGSVRILLMIIVQIIAVSVSVNLIAEGKLDIATAIFVLAYLQRIGSQLFVLGEIINGYEQALSEAAPMTDILARNVEVEDAPSAKKLRITEPSITLDTITYRYSNTGEDVIKELSLFIPAGQKVGIVGRSGAGKTTITHLLLRFSDVNSGAILINNQDIRSVTQESLRTTIAYVPQEPMLFHRSLRENIVYGNSNASEKAIIQAAKKANAWEFIQHLPDGLETLVGERGVKLSGGQRQRIAIARAILKDAPILLLDEATSALDSESEQLIQKSLDDLMKDRTSIVIAHRLSTISKLDRIIVIDEGRVIEDGAHENLISAKGVYAKLWAHQSGGFISE